jgi:hypothetical protein
MLKMPAVMEKARAPPPPNEIACAIFAKQKNKKIQHFFFDNWQFFLQVFFFSPKKKIHITRCLVASSCCRTGSRGGKNFTLGGTSMCLKRTADSSLASEAGAIGASGLEYRAKPGGGAALAVGLTGSAGYSQELMYEYMLIFFGFKKTFFFVNCV